MKEMYRGYYRHALHGRGLGFHCMLMIIFERLAENICAFSASLLAKYL